MLPVDLSVIVTVLSVAIIVDFSWFLIVVLFYDVVVDVIVVVVVGVVKQ